ncbi:ATP-binding protein [Deinococcus sonorensis]|uniref:histidine kinase n=2 Tax=Deinococcus sonorensis TaxID=309891 RepID=A0AAU7UGA7_9DEIO
MTTPDPLTRHEYQALLDDLLDPLFVLDRRWRYVLVNRQAERVLGVPAAELRGQVIWDVMTDLQGTELERLLRQAALSRSRVEAEVYYAPLRIWVELRVLPSLDGLAVQFRDVTGRHVDAEQRDQLLHLAQLLSTVTDANTALDTALRLGLPLTGACSGTVLALDPDSGQPTLWLTTGTVDPATARAEWDPADPELHGPLMQALHGGQAQYYRSSDLKAHPYLTRHKASRTRAVAALPLGLEQPCQLVLSFDSDRVFSEPERHVLTSLADQLTQTLRRVQLFQAESAAREQAQASEARYRALVRSLPQQVWIANRTGINVSTSEWWQALTGQLLVDAVGADGWGWLERVHPDDRDRVRHAWKVALRSLKPYRQEYRVQTVGGEYRDYEARGLPRLDEQGRAAEWVGTVDDITDRKAGERALQQTTAQLEQQVHERTRALQEETDALDAFVRFTALSSHAVSVPELAQLAVDVLQATLDHVCAGYYLPDMQQEGRWDMLPIHGARPGRRLPQTLHDVPVPEPSSPPTVLEQWQPLEGGPAFGAAAFYPHLVQGVPSGILSVASTRAQPLSERQQAIFRAVGRSMGLALERSAATRVLVAQQQALEAFALLARDLAFEPDPYQLVRRAQEIVLQMLPEGYGVYFEPDGGTWQLNAQTGTMGDSRLQQAVLDGLPFEQTGNLYQPWHSGEPLFQDSYDHGTDQLAEVTAHIGATATLPVMVNGRPRGVFAICLFRQHRWDSTERAMLGTAVRQLALALERSEAARQQQHQQRQLEAANRELEAFSYSVSHDLRAPLRHIIGFLGLLKRSLGSSLSDRSTHLLSVTEQAAQHMNTLIEELLVFARTAREPLSLRTVRLDQLVKDVQAQLRRDTQGRVVRWEVGALPEVQADPTLLRQVLMNLLSNALKYSQPRAEAVITVWAEPGEHGWVISVQDNGVGFDPKYRERLFGVFQRLHPASEFEGVGIGLANVQRIVQRHGGQVWAESQLGQGATFRFSLPA